MNWRALTAHALICTLAGLLPSAAWAEPGWQDEYADPEVYGAAEDEISAAEAEDLLLGLINAKRSEHGAGALELDPSATELALLRAAEIAEQRVASHYDDAGRKVEQRFNMLGRTDHATENLVLYEIAHEICLTPQLVSRMLEHWLAESGHRTNLLDPAHTAMGAGFFVGPDDVNGTTVAAAATVFVNEYGDCDRLPPAVAPGSRLWFTGFVTPGAAELAGISLAREDLADVLDTVDPLHYSMPEPSIVYVADGAFYPRDGGRPYLINAVDYNPDSGYFSVELYFPRHWQDCRVYVSVQARKSGARVFPVMTQVLEPRTAPPAATVLP